MAEKLINFYRITWEPSGMQTPLITRSQTITEIETALSMLREDLSLSFSINQINMSEKQFKERPQEMRHHGFAEPMN